MNDNDRFGLPLSLVEALRADPSPDATVLAELLARDETRAPPSPVRLDHRRSRQAALVILALGLAMGAHGYAAAQSVGTQSVAAQSVAGQSLEGRWSMAGPQSSFEESVTGAAPDAAVMTVTQDDADHLSYELTESRQGVEVARASYALSFAGAPSTSRVGDAIRAVDAARDARGDVVIAAPPVGPYRAVIHVRRTGPDSVLLEHDVEGAGQSTTLEEIRLVRAQPPRASHGWAQALNARLASRGGSYAR